ncbi:slipin family protein [Bdellovibrio sp. HCB209]|uniref:slipin family protein n=1 Tax=Bdellovibrio sp. HCB209 TaxID=3394354 RepID=UPI0039B62E83
MEFLIILLVVGGIILSSMVKILNEWDRGVVLRLGKAIDVRGPGLILLIPFVERMIKVDTRTIAMDVQPQDVITKDNVSMQVNAVVYFKVVSPMEAITKIEDFYFATGQLAQTTLRSVMGQYLLDDVLEHRDKINSALQAILDKHTEAWGIKVTMVEVKQIDLPKEMQRAMAREAEAERERRAKVISADGELQRAEKLAAASTTLAGSPSALQLAYLQTLSEIAGDKTNTIVFPLPLDMVKPFLGSDYKN